MGIYVKYGLFYHDHSPNLVMPLLRNSALNFQKSHIISSGKAFFFRRYHKGGGGGGGGGGV